MLKRHDLKLIVTSATIDTARFAEHFGNAPVINVEGRTWPVEVRYRALAEDRDERGVNQAIIAAVEEIGRSEALADVLDVPARRARNPRCPSRVVTTEFPRDGNPAAIRALVGEGAGSCVPSRTKTAHRVDHQCRQTSLTVPRIRAVIDTGSARVGRYSPRHKVQRLHIEPISQASADQRKGRCGRLGPGVCVRLYDEADFVARPRYTDPEILRASLANVVLRMLSLGLGDIARFPFLERPDERAINEGISQLVELAPSVKPATS